MTNEAVASRAVARDGTSTIWRRGFDRPGVRQVPRLVSRSSIPASDTLASMTAATARIAATRLNLPCYGMAYEHHLSKASNY